MKGLRLLDPSFVKDAPSPELPGPNEEAFKMVDAYVEKARASPPEVSTRAVSLIKSTVERHYANVLADVAVATTMLQSEK
ncbi:hypothetical protein AAC387_Pa07g1281 [Persea americana]